MSQIYYKRFHYFILFPVGKARVIQVEQGAAERGEEEEEEEKEEEEEEEDEEEDRGGRY